MLVVRRGGAGLGRVSLRIVAATSSVRAVRWRHSATAAPNGQPGEATPRSSGPASPTPPPPTLEKRVAAGLSGAFADHPWTSFALLGMSEGVVFTAIYQAIGAVAPSMHVSSAFLTAYVLHKLVGPTKYLAAVPVAFAIRRFAPVLSQVQIPALRLRGRTIAPGGLQHYGVAYLLSTRLVGVATTLALYVPLRYGVDFAAVAAHLPLVSEADVDSALASIEGATKTMGRVAVALTGAGFFMPLNLLSPLLAQPLHRLGDRLRGRGDSRRSGPSRE